MYFIFGQQWHFLKLNSKQKEILSSWIHLIAFWNWKRGFKSYRRYSTTFQMAVAVQFQNCTSLIVSGSNQKCTIWKKRNKGGVEIVAMILTLMRTSFWTFFAEHQWSSIIHYKGNWLQVLRSVDWRADSQKVKIGNCTLIVEMSEKGRRRKKQFEQQRQKSPTIFTWTDKKKTESPTKSRNCEFEFVATFSSFIRAWTDQVTKAVSYFCGKMS